MQKPSSLKPIWEINIRFLYAAFIFVLGWGYWHLSSKEWWFFGVLAWLCWISAAIYSVVAIVKIAEFVKQNGTITDFGEKGVEARGDKLADKEAMRKAGMIR